jgi:hypothetical protein
MEPIQNIRQFESSVIQLLVPAGLCTRSFLNADEADRLFSLWRFQHSQP